eukprot:7628896-Pyramimonas_sp.AAC.1
MGASDADLGRFCGRRGRVGGEKYEYATRVNFPVGMVRLLRLGAVLGNPRGPSLDAPGLPW